MFSRRIEAVVEQLVLLRIHVEAAIDFADEPLDTLGGAQVRRGWNKRAAIWPCCVAMQSVAVVCAMACMRC